MEQKVNLIQLPILDSMHDERIESIELKDKKLILHYNDLHFKHFRDNEFCACDIIFFKVEEADVFAEIRKRKGLSFKGHIYYDNDFIDYIIRKNYNIQTNWFYYGNKNVIIDAVLVDKNGRWREECTISIFANEILYRWR